MRSWPTLMPALPNWGLRGGCSTGIVRFGVWGAVGRRGSASASRAITPLLRCRATEPNCGGCCCMNWLMLWRGNTTGNGGMGLRGGIGVRSWELRMSAPRRACRILRHLTSNAHRATCFATTKRARCFATIAAGRAAVPGTCAVVSFLVGRSRRWGIWWFGSCTRATGTPMTDECCPGHSSTMLLFGRSSALSLLLPFAPVRAILPP